MVTHRARPAQHSEQLRCLPTLLIQYRRNFRFPNGKDARRNSRALTDQHLITGKQHSHRFHGNLLTRRYRHRALPEEVQTSTPPKVITRYSFGFYDQLPRLTRVVRSRKLAQNLLPMVESRNDHSQKCPARDVQPARTDRITEPLPRWLLCKGLGLNVGA
jgi:hypothetical protein